MSYTEPEVTLNAAIRTEAIDEIKKALKKEGAQKSKGWKPSAAAENIFDSRIEMVTEAHGQFMETMRKAKINPQKTALAEGHSRRLCQMMRDFPGLEKDFARKLIMEAFAASWEELGVN